MADNGVAGARTRSSEVVLSPGVRPGVFRGPWRAVLRYAGSCLVFKYQFVASDPSCKNAGATGETQARRRADETSHIPAVMASENERHDEDVHQQCPR